jgi:hypothetical protein
MKEFKFLITLFILTIFVSGCSEEFLQEPAPTDKVSGAVVFASRAAAEAHISGMLRLSRAQYAATDTGGLNSLYFARSVKGNDLVMSANWFLFDYAHENREPNYRRVNFVWEFCYYMIYQANALINGLPESPLSDVDKAELTAQARAIRGFYYFQLAMEFQDTYAVGKSKPSLPIYTEVSTDGKPMSTLQEVYDQILSDLTLARDLGSASRIDKSYINTNVINAMLSRVYLVMENWSAAETAANNARQGFPLSASGYANGFNNLEGNEEWIWGMPQSLDQSNYYWGWPHAGTDFYTLSYSAVHWNDTFVNSFSDTDVRNIFVSGALGGTPADWFYHISRKWTFTFDADHSIFRSAEMILTEAECKARQGDDPGAHSLLFSVQSNRDPLAVMSSNTGADLIEEILFERRKELYGEVGTEWFDAKRLQRGITRDGNHRVFVTLEPNDKRFYLKIPQKEIDSNDFIDETINDGR